MDKSRARGRQGARRRQGRNPRENLYQELNQCPRLKHLTQMRERKREWEESGRNTERDFLVRLKVSRNEANHGL